MMLIIATILTIIATTLVCEVPVIAKAFGFTGVTFAEYLVAIGLGLCVIPIVEIVKLIQRKAEKDI